MNRFARVVILPFVSVTSVLCQPEQSACWKTATTQLEMNRCASKDAADADTKLNQVYQQLLSKLKGDENATKKLRAAQRAWLAFRDAELQALFPAQDKQREYGSIYPMCHAQLTAATTNERTAQLRKMLDGKSPCAIYADADK